MLVNKSSLLKMYGILHLFAFCKSKLTKAAFAVCALLIIRKLFWKEYYKYYNYPPGPFNFWIPFFGEFFAFVGNGYKLTCDNAKIYGKVMTIPMGASNIIFINDLELAKKLLCSGRFDFRDVPIADTLTFINHKQWRVRRKLLTSTLFTLMKTEFVLNNVKYALSICSLTKNMQNVAKNEYFVWNAKNIIGDLQYISFMNIMKAIWGKTFEINDPFVSKWIDCVNKTFENSARTFIFYMLINNRKISNFITKYMLNTKESDAEFRLNIAEEWCNNNGFKLDLERNILQNENKKSKEPNVYYIDHVIEYLEKKENENIVTVKKIMNDISEIMLVATDTTTITTYGGLLLLAKHQQIQQEIYKEVMAVLSANNKKEFDFSILSKLHLFRAFVNDIIRCTTNVPSGLPRKVESDYAVKVVDGNGEQCGYTIHKCDTIYFNHVYINKKQWRDMYGDGNDANNAEIEADFELYLDAWLDEKGHFKANPNSMTFAKGRRNCPGANMAIKWMYSLFASLIIEYRFELEANAKWKQSYNTVSGIEPMLAIKVEKR